MNSNGEIMVATLPGAILPHEEQQRITSLTTEALRLELAHALEHTAQALLRLAWVVRELESRGEDVSDLRLPLLTYLRQIAGGQLLPGVVARFTECPSLIRRAARLSMHEQHGLASGEGVLLVVRTPDGTAWTHRIADPTRMLSEQVSQVFAPDHLRGEAEQILYLEGRAKVPAKASALQRHGNVRADRERKGIMIGRTFVALENVLAALADLAPDEDAGERTETVAAKVTAAEHRALKVSALDGPAVSEQIRRALRIAGLI